MPAQGSMNCGVVNGPVPTMPDFACPQMAQGGVSAFPPVPPLPGGQLIGPVDGNGNGQQMMGSLDGAQQNCQTVVMAQGMDNNPQPIMMGPMNDGNGNFLVPVGQM